MKIAFYLFVTFSIVCSAHAQKYRNVKVGFALSYIGNNKPRAAAFEMAYRINDYMAVGYRAEVAHVQSNSVDGNSVHSNVLYSQSYLSGFHKKFRPFVSLGLGQFKPSTDMNGGCGMPHADRNINIEKKIGIFTRVGFDLGHLTLTVDTNLAVKSKSIVESNLSPTDLGYHDPYVQYLNNSYVSIKLGVFFGGGKKKVKSPKLQ